MKSSILPANIPVTIKPILSQHQVTAASLFGSYARNEAKASSDVDILIAFPKNKSLLEFIALKLDLEKVLHRRVDLVEYDSIKPALRKQIIGEQITVL